MGLRLSNSDLTVLYPKRVPPWALEVTTAPGTFLLLSEVGSLTGTNTKNSFALLSPFLDAGGRAESDPLAHPEYLHSICSLVSCSCGFKGLDVPVGLTGR